MTFWRVNFSFFSNAKNSYCIFFFNISPRAKLAYEIYPIKFLSLNTVKILDLEGYIFEKKFTTNNFLDGLFFRNDGNIKCALI